LISVCYNINRMQYKTRQRLSRLRQQLVRMKDQPGQLVPVFLGDRPLLKGTVYPLRRRCGKPSCRCAQGKLHESLVLTASVGGRTRLQSLSEDKIERARELTQRYQQVRTARAEFVKLYTQMVKIIDAIERLRRVKP